MSSEVLYYVLNTLKYNTNFISGYMFNVVYVISKTKNKILVFNKGIRNRQ